MVFYEGKMTSNFVVKFVLVIIVRLVGINAQNNNNNNDNRYSYALLLRNAQKELRGDFEIRYPNKSNPHSSKLQQPFPKPMPFPCSNSTKFGIGRSITKPTSVHKLRPGDIDVVAAMGDSLVAGNGAMEDWALGTMIENRGISWCIGGEGNWRQFLTVPNILKEFNPRLTGYSTGTGEFLSQHARLNVAFPVSADADALRQAKILVRKMKEDPNIDVEDDWKMVTVFFGANDLCSAQCYNRQKASPYSHATKLMVALDYLQKYLPRTFVNLIPVLDVTTSVRIKRSLMCKLMHRLFCACFHQNGNEMNILMNMANDYQRAEESLVYSGRYDTKEDFTVVIQPFMKMFNAPRDLSRLYEEVIDISYITHDCFHFSQKGHALGANLLWNNLLEPVGAKTVTKMKYIMEKFLCPSSKTPYFFTNKNSKIYYATGYQE